MRCMRQIMMAAAVCALSAGAAHASTEYLVEDSDVDINIGNGTTFDLELYVTEDAGGNVEKVAFKGYAFNDNEDPVEYEIDFGATGLHDMSGAWTYDNARAPKLSATDGDGGRATRVTHRADSHVMEWELSTERITVVVEGGLGDYLEQEGLLQGSGTQDYDGVLATVLANDAALGVHLDEDPPTTGIEECLNAARDTCSIDCDGDGEKESNCINTLKYFPSTGICMFSCYLEEQCCGP